MIDVRREPPTGPASQALFRDYMALVQERLGPAFAPTPDIFATEAELEGPGAAWIVLYDDAVPVGCGGLRPAAPGVAEIKRMFVAPDARGRGHGRRLLAELEALAADAGCERVQLLTTEVLVEARDLYRSSGYEITATERRAGRVDFWLEKRLPG
jgi:GNAT superfamily N-acetyltransferase